MKNKLIFKKQLLTILLYMFAALILSSCGDDTVQNNTQQNTEGPQPTETGTPNGAPVSATIGSSGGSIMSSDSSIELTVPPGALNSSTEITIQPVTNFCHNGRGNAFRFTPDGLQFSQPITMRFRYSDTTLESTHGMLMGIAYQNSTGYWKYLNDITNDTVNMVISVQINDFSSSRGTDASTGGRDFSFFDIAHLEPSGASLPVNGHLTLRVRYINTTEDEELAPLPHPIGSWWISPLTGGGVIESHHDQIAVYKAPPNVPSQNPVTVGANVNTRLNYRGQVIEQCALSALVKIKSGDHVYDLSANVSGNFMWLAQYSCMYSDGVNLVVTVRSGIPSTVTISNILNRFPGVVPPNGTFPNGQGSISWLPETIGMTNVSIGTAYTYGVNQDHLTINLQHTGNLLLPKWHCVPEEGEPYDVGGTQGVPVPTELNFLISDSVQTFYHNYGIVAVNATLTPRNP
jgi:hypothetical protein